MIWDRIYLYFNPPFGELLRHWGIIDDSEMTPEEWEECQKKLEQLYAKIEAYYSSDDKSANDEKDVCNTCS